MLLTARPRPRPPLLLRLQQLLLLLLLLFSIVIFVVAVIVIYFICQGGRLVIERWQCPRFAREVSESLCNLPLESTESRSYTATNQAHEQTPLKPTCLGAILGSIRGLDLKSLLKPKTQVGVSVARSVYRDFLAHPADACLTFGSLIGHKRGCTRGNVCWLLHLGC